MSDSIAGPDAPLLVERAAAAWYICLNRPEKRSARTDGTVSALRAALAAVPCLLTAAEPAALRATRRLVALAIIAPLPTALDAAELDFAGLLRHGNVHEGIAAASERRAPARRAPVTELPGFQ
jgi:enoyl-CoA hydratase/carnithine racemase